MCGGLCFNCVVLRKEFINLMGKYSNLNTCEYLVFAVQLRRGVEAVLTVQMFHEKKSHSTGRQVVYFFFHLFHPV